MAASNANVHPTENLESPRRPLRRLTPLRVLRKLARHPVRYFFYRFVYLRENAFSRTIRPFLKVVRIKSKEQWDSQYKRGVWDLLHNLHEQAHYAILLSYVIHLRPMSSVLDVGCGNGLFYTWLRPFDYKEYVGVDLSEAAIASCASYSDKKTSFLAANAEEYVPDRIFDVIVFSELLYYLREPGKVLERYATYLANDGIFVVSLCQGDRSEAIGRFLRSNFSLIDETVVTNSKGTWFCFALKPRVHDAAGK